jgi:glycosyltransferase involved in cell wall biosynthesis
LLEQYGISNEETVVTHVSNLKSLKRTADLLHAAKKALSHNPRLVFFIIGDGNLRPEIEESCRLMNLQNAFRFTGWIDYSQVPDYLNISDMVVMPSQSEARAMVFLETQACGRVLIASNIPSAREVIEHGKTGLLFSVGNIEELGSRILFAAAHPEMRDQIGHDARQAALHRPLRAFVDQYETAFQEVVAQHQFS